MTVENNSDAIRRAALRKQKEAVREKELLIKNALQSVDAVQNKKIVFDDNFGEGDEEEEKDVGKNSKDKKTKRTLFEDDDDDDEDEEGGESDNEEFDFSENKKPKVVNLGNDPRFAMDQRFSEDAGEGGKEEEGANEEPEDELTSERKKQLEILQSVLGKPIAQKNETQVPVKRKNQMIRYDPTQDDHQKHELQQEEPKPKKKKRKTSESKAEEKEEEKPIPVSTEIFYSVAENLTETLKASEEFSLLKQFGAPPEKNNDVNEEKTAVDRKARFTDNFDARNPFKYDSSDDEEEIPQENKSKQEINKIIEVSSIEDTFFIHDLIFKEAEDFFRTPAASNESFSTLRKELKEIVRSKIRKNTRKTQVWKRKKINTVKKRK